jgi:hypothetical protein
MWTALLLAGLAAPAFPQTKPPTVEALEGVATAMDGEWHFLVAPYFWFSGVEGRVSMKGIAEVPVDASFSDVWSNFDIGFLARFEGRKDRWGFGVDVNHINLGMDVAPEAPILGQRELVGDMRLTLLEGFGTYRVAWNDRGALLDVIVGVRFVGTSAQLKGEVGSTDLESTTKQSLDWVDLMGGLRFSAPLGSKVAFHGRTDVATSCLLSSHTRCRSEVDFQGRTNVAGLGSQISWNIQASLSVALGKRWSVGAGYRRFDVGYEADDGQESQLFDVVFSGPHAFVAYAW